jgi:hypothetical protein
MVRFVYLEDMFIREVRTVRHANLGGRRLRNVYLGRWEAELYRYLDR